METSRPSEESTDDMFIRLALSDADLYDQPISDPVARAIANQYHDGQKSALYSFVSTGALKGSELSRELVREYNNAEPDEKPALYQLLRYVTTNWGEEQSRGPVENWHELSRWDNGDQERDRMRHFGRVPTSELIQIVQADPETSVDAQRELTRRYRLLGRFWMWAEALDGSEVIEVYLEGGES